MYLYSGAADVGALTGDASYMDAMKAVWQDVVNRNMYVTGGIGSAGDNEGFSRDYDLPNEEAYCETCASVGMVLWNQRMCQLTGDSKYIDVLERSLYNGALDGLSLKGDRFFYDNVLASNGQHQRREWFGTACCPANIARLVTSVGNYVYGKSRDGIWINLFISSNTAINLAGNNVGIKMQTGYPYGGDLAIKVDPEKKARFKMYIRVPGWLDGRGKADDLYQLAASGLNERLSYKINNGTVEYAEKLENGYLVIDREWQKMDVIKIDIPLNVKKVIAVDSVKADRDRVAIQRGPLVYCVEGADNENQVWNIVLPVKPVFNTIPLQILDEKVIDACRMDGRGRFALADPRIADVQCRRDRIAAGERPSAQEPAHAVVLGAVAQEGGDAESISSDGWSARPAGACRRDRTAGMPGRRRPRPADWNRAGPSPRPSRRTRSRPSSGSGAAAWRAAPPRRGRSNAAVSWDRNTPCDGRGPGSSAPFRPGSSRCSVSSAR